MRTITIRAKDLKVRARTEHYFDCPHCGEEVSDLDVGMTGSIECPDCGGSIYIEED